MIGATWTIEQTAAWPFPRANQIRKFGEMVWLQITEEHADNLLGAVPPIYVKGGFMVGEEDSYSEWGARHATVLQFDGCSYLAIVSRRELDDYWRAGLRAAINARILQPVVTCTKRALIRDANAPIGQPAAVHVNCGCGKAVPIVADANKCDCGMCYDRAGWIVSAKAVQR